MKKTMNHGLLLRFLLIVCWSSVHMAFKRHLWNNLNDRTKQTFEDAEAKEVFFSSKDKSEGWLSPDNETRRAIDTKKFGGGHANASACIKAVRHYLDLSAQEYVKGGRKNIKKSAYYFTYGMHFMEDMCCPVHRYSTCDKAIRKCHKRFETRTLPYNGTSKDKINKKTKEVISFGSPRTYNLNELGLGDNDLKSGDIFKEILQMTVSEDYKVNDKGDTVVTNDNNTTFLTNKAKEWQKLVKKTHTKTDEQKLMMETIAFGLNFVKAYVDECAVTSLFFSSADAYLPEPIPTKPSPSEQVELPKSLDLETLTPSLETDPTVNWGNNTLILTPDFRKLSWIDNEDVVINEKNVLGGFKTLDITVKMSNKERDMKLWKQGNLIFINGDSDNERCLYILKTKVKKDFKNNILSLEADEYLSVLNDLPPFYVYDTRWKKYVEGNNIVISKEFLKELLKGYYIIDDTTAIDLYSYDENGHDLSQDPRNPESKKRKTVYGLTKAQKSISVDGTITIIDLLRKIEKKTGAYFKTHYTPVDNFIQKKIELLLPFRYGREHINPIEGIQLGRNTNELTYGTDEQDNAVGIAPIIDSDKNDAEDSSDSVDYKKLIEDWYRLDINNETNDVDTSYLTSDSEFDKEIDYSIEIWGEGAEGIREEKTTTTMPHTVKKNNKDDNSIPLAEQVGLATKNYYDEEGNLEISTQDPVIVDFDETGTFYNRYGIINVDDYLGECEPIIHLKRNYNTAMEQKLNPNGVVEIIVKTIGIAEDNVTEEKLLFAGDMNPTTKNAGIAYGSDIEIDLSKKTVQYTKHAYSAEQFEITTRTTKTSNTTTTKQKEIAPPTKKGTYCQCGKYKWGKWYYTVFKNECPFCKAKGLVGRLKWHQSTSNSGKKTKGQQNKELRCKRCGADFCGACGRDKDRRRRKSLTKISSSVSSAVKSTTEDTKSSVSGWYQVDVTVSEESDNEKYEGDSIVVEDEKKVLFRDVFTQDSVFPRFYGSIEIECIGCHIAKIESSNAKIYEFAEFPWVKQRDYGFVYSDRTDLPFNYKVIYNNPFFTDGAGNITFSTPKIRNITTSATTVEDVLIDVGEELGWSNTVDTLDLFEEVTTDLVDKNNTIYNMGDTVYLKTPDGNTFKAIINETNKNRAKRGEGTATIGQIRNAPLSSFWWQK